MSKQKDSRVEKIYRVKHHIVPVWKASVFFCEVDDCEKLVKKHKLNLPSYFEFKNYDGFFWKEKDRKGGEKYYLVVRPIVKTGVIVHECVHMALQMLEDLGVKTQSSEDEPLCYLTEHLFEQAERFFTKK